METCQNEKVNLAAKTIVNSVINHKDFVKTIFHPIKITINVRGIKYDVRWKSLEKLPTSRLGKIRYSRSLQELKNYCDDVIIQKNEIYFNKSSKIFENILEAYFTTNAHFNSNYCMVSLCNDIKYWGIDEYGFNTCCILRYADVKDGDLKVLTAIKKFVQTKEHVVNNYFPITMQKLWIIMEYPQSSMLSRVILIFEYC